MGREERVLWLRRNRFLVGSMIIGGLVGLVPTAIVAYSGHLADRLVMECSWAAAGLAFGALIGAWMQGKVQADPPEGEPD